MNKCKGDIDTATLITRPAKHHPKHKVLTVYAAEDNPKRAPHKSNP